MSCDNEDCTFAFSLFSYSLLSQLWLEMTRITGRELRETARERLDVVLQTVQEKTGCGPGMNETLILFESSVVQIQ